MNFKKLKVNDFLMLLWILECGIILMRIMLVDKIFDGVLIKFWSFNINGKFFVVSNY